MAPFTIWCWNHITINKKYITKNHYTISPLYNIKIFKLLYHITSVPYQRIQNNYCGSALFHRDTMGCTISPLCSKSEPLKLDNKRSDNLEKLLKKTQLDQNNNIIKLQIPTKISGDTEGETGTSRSAAATIKKANSQNHLTFQKNWSQQLGVD